MQGHRLDLYVFHRSYYCSKMMAYLRYRQIPHNLLYKPLAEVGDALIENTGLRVMPVIQLNDGRWMSDTTPMILWFERGVPESPGFAGRSRVCIFLPPGGRLRR